MYKILFFVLTFLTAIFLQPSILIAENAASTDTVTSFYSEARELMPPNPETYPEVYTKENKIKFNEGKSKIEPKAYPKTLQRKASVARASMLAGSKTEKVLVIPLEFQDVKFKAGHTPEYFNNLFTASSYSVKDYYEKNSNYSPGVRGITLDVYVAPVTMSVRNMVYYGEDGQDIDDANGDVSYMIAEAVKRLDDSGFDFSSFDANNDGIIDHLVVIHAGDGQEDSRNTNTIWSHRGSILEDCQVDEVRASNYATTPEGCQIGTICHEFGHDMGLPDLYDTDYAENGETYGVGDWDIMGNGAWNALPGKPAGSCPANLSIFSKAILGWVEPEEITQDGQYTLVNTSGNNSGFQISAKSPQDDELFLIEYRKKSGYDEALPGEGLLVWHIDLEVVRDTISWNMINSYAYRQGVELEQADGFYDLWTLYNQGDNLDPFSQVEESRNFVAIPGVPFLWNYCNEPKVNKNYSDYSYVEIRDINISGDTATAYYEVEKKSPSVAPKLTGPANQYFLKDTQPELDWNLVPMSTDYWVQISEDKDFKTLVLDKYNLKYDEQGELIEQPCDDINTRAFTLNANFLNLNNYNGYSYKLQSDEALEPGKMYFWRVAAINPMTNTDNIKWSEAYEIYTPGYISVSSSVYNVSEGNENEGIIKVAINGGNFISGGVLDASTVRL